MRSLRLTSTECDAKYSATPGTEDTSACRDRPLIRLSQLGSSHSRETVLSSRPDTKATSDMVKPASSVTCARECGLDQSIMIFQLPFGVGLIRSLVGVRC